MAVTRRWLLDLTIDGRVYRWSTEAVDVVDARGATHRYEAGLAALEVAQSDSVSVSVVDAGVDWTALGARVSWSPAVLRRWAEGSVLDDAETYASGEAVDVTWSTAHEPLALAIAQPLGPQTLGLPAPDREAQVTEATWPITALHEIGETSAWYPVVYGYPGYDGTSTPYPVVPVPLAQWEATTPATTYLVIADRIESQIASVTLWHDDYALTSTTTADWVIDGLGRYVQVVDFAGIPTLQPTSPRARHHAAYTPTGGGGAVRDAYSVLRDALSRWGASTVDWERLPEAAEELGRYQVDTWIDDQVSDVWAWAEGTILADTPVEPRRGPRGWYLVVRRYTADPRLVVGAYSVDVGSARRVSSLSRDGEPITRWSAAYRIDREGQPRARVYLVGSVPSPAPDPTAAQLVRVAQSGRCLAAESRWGVRDGGDLTIDWTWDTATALACLEWRAARWALPALLVTYELDDGETLREGDQVELVDTELGIDRTAIVDAPPVRGLASGWSRVLLRLPEEAP